MTIEDVYMACETAYAQSVIGILNLMLRDTAYCKEALTTKEEKKIEEILDWFETFERERVIALSENGLA